VINRSKTRDIPKMPVIVQGRIAVRNSGRGNHLGQRSCASATKGQTSLKVLPPAPNSGVFDLPITMPPLRSIRSTSGCDFAGT
jgi:hypothetical protein